MDIKEFKKRWLRGCIQPELFYLPVEETTKTGTLHISILYYTSFNVADKQYSNNNSLTNTMVFAEFVLKNNKGEIVYITPKGDDRVWGANLILPYGTYYIKILKAYGATFDNEFHEILLDEEHKYYKYFCEFCWVSEKRIISNDNDCKIWIEEPCGNDTWGNKIQNVSVGAYYSKIQMIKEDKNKIIAEFSAQNVFKTIGMSSSYYSQTYGTLPARAIYSTKQVAEISYYAERNYYYRYGTGNGSVATGYINEKGTFSQSIVANNSRLGTAWRTPNCQWIIQGNMIYDDYLSLDSENYICYSSPIVELQVNTTKTANALGIVTVDTSDECGYRYGNLSPSNIYPESRAALIYFLNKNYFNEVDENYFSNGNFIVFKFTTKPPNASYDIGGFYCVTNYANFQEATESGYYDSNYEKVPKYEDFYLDKDYEYSDVLCNGLYNYGKRYFEIICDRTKGMTFNINSYYLLGYQTQEDISETEQIVHLINSNMPVFADDYNDY